jgi:RNA polymerase sigma-70 factor (ECF subfamily)
VGPAAEYLAELEAERAVGIDEAALAARLDELWAAAARQWPAIAPVDPIAFARCLAQRSTGTPPEIPRHAGDLYLACGCLAGDSLAIGIVEQMCVIDGRRAVRHMRLAEDAIDEAIQRTRIRVLVGGDAGPRLADYRGTGELRAWLRAVAIREALMLLRTRGKYDDVDELVLATEDPVLDALKARYRDLFRSAFEHAVARLTPQERTLLRQTVIDRVPVERLATLHGVHRVTASRWLQRIRRTLYEHTRSELAGKIDATPDQLDSVMRLIDSQLEASVERILRSQGG